MVKHLALILLCCISTSAFSQQWHVYVFIAEHCPICNYMGKPLSDIARKYEKEDVAFHAVFPLKNSNYKTTYTFKEKFGMQSFETLIDKDLAIAKKLGATVTPEVVITDELGTVRYRGRINSAYYAPGKMKHSSIKNDLDEALTSLLSGREAPVPWPAAIGCFITLYGSN